MGPWTGDPLASAEYPGYRFRTRTRLQPGIDVVEVGADGSLGEAHSSSDLSVRGAVPNQLQQGCLAGSERGAGAGSLRASTDMKSVGLITSASFLSGSQGVLGVPDLTSFQNSALTVRSGVVASVYDWASP